MKKTLLFVAAVIALAACSKENPVKEDGPIDASKIVFNIQVENADATKAVKTAWESGDVVYVFFEGNTTQYVKMTFTAAYSSGYWTYTDKNGGTNFVGLNLATSGKKVSAVYMPSFVCSDAPSYDSEAGKWTFGAVGGYIQTAQSVDYTVTSTSNITTLSATIRLIDLPRISQVFIPSTEYSAPASGNEHVLTATHFRPFTFNGIAPGGTASFGLGTDGFPLTAYSGTIGSDTGYYFWGILEGAGTYDFTFQLVERNADKKYAISSKSKSVASKTVGANVAIKLSGLTDNGKFVSLGYAGSPLWATGNLDKTNNTIVDPLLAGEYFMYGYITTYNYGDDKYTGTENPLSTDHDAAYQANNSWRIPTRAQFADLISSFETTVEWKAGWTSIGSTGGGRLITSKSNGLSLFFAATGSCEFGTLDNAGVYGYYRSSTPDYADFAYTLYFSDGTINTGGIDRKAGQAIRPVKN